MQGGCINVLQSPIGAQGMTPRQEEVVRCLEAVSAASQVSGRLWNFQRRKRYEGQSPCRKPARRLGDANTPELPALSSPRMIHSGASPELPSIFSSALWH